MGQLQSMLMLKSHHHFSDEDKQLLKYLFGSKLLDDSAVVETHHAKLTDENNKLFLELRNEYDV